MMMVGFFWAGWGLPSQAAEQTAPEQVFEGGASARENPAGWVEKTIQIKKSDIDKHREQVEKVIESHVKDQRGSKELTGRDDSSLYVRILEFHDRDGDGVPDHDIQGHSASELQKAFDPGQNKRLKAYTYLESYRGFKLDDLTVRHLQRKIKQEQAQKAQKLGGQYATEVMKTISDDKGNMVSDLALDAMRDMNQKMTQSAEEAFQFQRIKRIEKVLEMRSAHRARLKEAYQVTPAPGLESKTHVGPKDRLDSRKKSGAEFEATSVYSSDHDREQNLRAFDRLLEEYKKSHPNCLKSDWNCYVDKSGRIVEQHITDSYDAAEQVLDAQEYEAQQKLEWERKGKAFRERLPGELENLSPAEQKAIREARALEQKRLDLIKHMLTRKKQTVLEGGRLFTREVSTGEAGDATSVTSKAKVSAFKDARQGKIDLDELRKEEPGKSSFKTLDY
jgi:hypothetical protein